MWVRAIEPFRTSPQVRLASLPCINKMRILIGCSIKTEKRLPAFVLLSIVEPINSCTRDKSSAHLPPPSLPIGQADRIRAAPPPEREDGNWTIFARVQKLQRPDEIASRCLTVQHFAFARGNYLIWKKVGGGEKPKRSRRPAKRFSICTNRRLGNLILFRPSVALYSFCFY